MKHIILFLTALFAVTTISAQTPDSTKIEYRIVDFEKNIFEEVTTQYFGKKRVESIETVEDAKTLVAVKAGIFNSGISSRANDMSMILRAYNSQILDIFDQVRAVERQFPEYKAVDTTGIDVFTKSSFSFYNNPTYSMEFSFKQDSFFRMQYDRTSVDADYSPNMFILRGFDGKKVVVFVPIGIDEKTKSVIWSSIDGYTIIQHIK